MVRGAMRAMTFAMDVSGGLGSPFAPAVNPHMETGPKVSSTGRAARHAASRPTKAILWVRAVLPIGVLQQDAYQRSGPLSVIRRQARRSAPWVMVTKLGSVWTTSE